MYSLAWLVVVGVVALVVGTWIGHIIARVRSGAAARIAELEAQLGSARDELSDYKGAVHQQFSETARKFKALDESYHDLHRQLAESAGVLCGEAAGPLLAAPGAGTPQVALGDLIEEPMVAATDDSPVADAEVAPVAAAEATVAGEDASAAVAAEAVADTAADAVTDPAAATIAGASPDTETAVDPAAEGDSRPADAPILVNEVLEEGDDLVEGDLVADLTEASEDVREPPLAERIRRQQQEEQQAAER